MKLQIQALHQAASLKERLEREGWKVGQEEDGSLLASHKAVTCEPDARLRLYRMGLLTSPNLRIRFLTSVPRPRP